MMLSSDVLIEVALVVVSVLLTVLVWLRLFGVW